MVSEAVGLNREEPKNSHQTCQRILSIDSRPSHIECYSLRRPVDGVGTPEKASLPEWANEVARVVVAIVGGA